jgi:hypothetical protein
MPNRTGGRHVCEGASMTVQDTASTVTVTVPRQAGPADLAPAAPPAGAAGPAAAIAAPAPPLLGRDRPLTVDERQFVVGLAVMWLFLGSIIVAGLGMAQYAWA